jgi:Tol biopolymer transport system component
LLQSSTVDTPSAFSPDDKLLLFDRFVGANGSWDIWALPLTQQRQPYPVVATPFMDAQAVFSPDGRWIAYESDDTGVRQVYAQPFPPDGRRVRLSTTSGSGAHWTANGTEVVYSTVDFHFMAVHVDVSGGDLRAEAPRELFVRAHAGGAQSFAIDASGQRFLMPIKSGSDTQAPITVLVNGITKAKN